LMHESRLTHTSRCDRCERANRGHGVMEVAESGE
jgi:hypothetical protein